jgi:hypothetical protein
VQEPPLFQIYPYSRPTQRVSPKVDSPAKLADGGEDAPDLLTGMTLA